MNNFKRLLSLVLTLCMVVSIFAVSSVTSSARTFVGGSAYRLIVTCTNITPTVDSDDAFNVNANKCDKKNVTIQASTELDISNYRVKNMHFKCSYNNTVYRERDDIVNGPTNDYIASHTWDTTSWEAGVYNIYVSSAVDAKNALGSFTQTGKGWENQLVGTITVQNGGHSYSWVTTTNPTCTATGVESYKCSKCGDISNTRTVNALGHDYSNKTVSSTYLKDEATCTNPAVYYYKCSRCSAKGTTTYTSGSALGHNWNNGEITAQPTCTGQGVKTYTCTRDISHTKTEPVAALGHSWDNGTITTQPGCTTAGVKTYYCTRDNSHTKTEAVESIGHSWDSGTIIAQPTCTQTGVKQYRCFNDASHTYTENVDALGHDYSSQNTDNSHLKSAATCTEAAVYYKSCSRCGANGTETFESGSPLGHNAVTDAAVPATCTQTGLTAGSHCSRCNVVLTAQEVVPATGHTAVEDAAVPATCTQTGLTAGTHCSVCGVVLTAQQSVPATGHTVVEDAAVAPSCTQEGLTAGSHCSVCGAVLVAQQTVSATGHTAPSDWTVVTPATCTTAGLKEKRCTICDTLIESEAIDALGHIVVEDAAVPATCTSTGLTAGSHCSRCDAVLVAQETTEALGHTIVEDAAVPATCTATGLTAGSHCSVCGVVFVTQQEVPATGHTAPAEWTVVTPANCTTAGLKEKRCTICDTLLESAAIDATGHTVVEDAAVPATCTQTGLTAGSHCSICGAVLVAQETVEALGHTIVEDAAVPATCTATGLTAGSHCSVCGVVFVAQETTEALGHTIVEDAAVPATCTATGLTAGSHCSVCGVVFVTQQEVAATGHTPGAATTEKVDGVDKHVTRCTVCNTILYVEEIGSADYTAVNAAIAAANALTASEYYDISGVTAAVNAVERGLNADHQAEVDAMATAITSAIAALVPITSVLKLADAVATADGRIITVSPKADAESITVYPTLKNGNTITFANRTGGAKISKSGSLYARSYGTATTTINGTVYTIILDMPDVEVVETPLVDNLKVDFATASVSGTTITLTPNAGASYVSFYPTLKDGTAVTFGSRTGAAKLSSNGTLTARNYGTAKATIDGVEYTVILDMPEEVVPEKSVSDLIKTANATVAVDGTTITLTPKSESVQVSIYPTLKDSTVIEFTGRTGATKISKSGTLYAKAYGTAKTTINNTEYTIVFNFAAPTTTVADVIKTANATVEVEGTTITLTAINPGAQISLYPTTKDGKTVTFSERSGAKVSKNGTCYAKQNASCTMTIDGTDYTVNFVFA